MRAIVLALTAVLVPTAVHAGTPFGGTPIRIPGLWQAEDFDRGGQGVGYLDLNHPMFGPPGNDGGSYRVAEDGRRSDVDIVPGGTGFIVNHIEQGEWMTYTVEAPRHGSFHFGVLYSQNFADPVYGSGPPRGPGYRVEIDGAQQASIHILSRTPSFADYQWSEVGNVIVGPGLHEVKLISVEPWFNLDAIRMRASPTTPYEGALIPVPGTWKVDRWDEGGHMWAFYETPQGTDNPLDESEGCRTRGGGNPDLKYEPAVGGCVLNQFQDGEWLGYTVEVAQSPSGRYDVGIEYSNNWGTNVGEFDITIDDVKVGATMLAPITGGWDQFRWSMQHGVAIDLSPGRHVVRLIAKKRYFNVNRLTLVAAP